MTEETQDRAQAMVEDAHARGQLARGMEADATFAADRQWFRKHRGVRERVRPATVEEQTTLFEAHGGEVFDRVRITTEIVFDRGIWTVHVIDPA